MHRSKNLLQQKIVRQHLGIAEIITTILEKLGDVKSVAITGDYAQGIDSGTINVALLGDKIDIGYLKDIIKKMLLLLSKRI